MKSILIFRHGKSDWSNPLLSDIERPLAKRGLKDAPRMGQFLARFGCIPDLILSSPSMRTRQTVELLAMECGYTKAIRWENSLYGGTAFDSVAILQHLPDKIERPMLVGHNPGIEETVSNLLAPSPDYPNGRLKICIPTAGLVYLEADIVKWKELKPGICLLRWFLIPRLVKAMM